MLTHASGRPMPCARLRTCAPVMNQVDRIRSGNCVHGVPGPTPVSHQQSPVTVAPKRWGSANGSHRSSGKIARGSPSPSEKRRDSASKLMRERL